MSQILNLGIMRGLSMLSSTKNTFTLLAFVFTLPFFVGQANAQGVVSLGDEINSDEPKLSIPDEDAIFTDNSEQTAKKIASSGKASAGVKSAADLLGGSSGESGVKSAADLLGGSSGESEVKSAADLLGGSSQGTESSGLDNIPSSFMPKPSASLGSSSVTDNNNADALINDPIFSKASDLEKQTTLLNLELRKEQVKNEIEAIKKQRQLAIEEEKEKKEAKAKAKIEWEKAQEQKVIQEQQKLRELDISFEKLRQERVLNAYKNVMLGEHQKWIENSEKLHDEVKSLKSDRQAVLEDAKNKIDNLKNIANMAKIKIAEAKGEYKREIADLQSQISVLKTRIDAQEKEIQVMEAEKQNPFADANAAGDNTAQTNPAVEEVKLPEAKLSEMYAVMEIRGQGGELIAKLMNKSGASFFVRQGTVLQSGHVIDEIATNYVSAVKDGIKDYLYFSAGGVVTAEPEQSLISALSQAAASSEEDQAAPGLSFVTSAGVPSLGGEMIGR